ncbi:MAG: TonB-dependent siderophore receptor [Opitutaceae bacterium]
MCLFGLTAIGFVSFANAEEPVSAEEAAEAFVLPTAEDATSEKSTSTSTDETGDFNLEGAAAEDTNKDDDIFVVSPFEVNASQDEGYYSAQSMAGSRFAQDLKNTPAPIDVMTSELLDDLGVFDLDEAMAWSVNAISSSSTDNSSAEGAGLVDAERRSSNVRVRGIQVTQARNFFKWSINNDKFNIDRIDTSRGPNAMLFGDSSLSGLSNITTKKAHFKQSVKTQLMYDSFGGGRAEIDVNVPVIKEKLALRFNAFTQDTDSWNDYGNRKRDGLALAATWRPFKGVVIRAEGEKGNIEDIYPKAILRGRISDWDGITTSSTGALTNGQATAAGLTTNNNNAFHYIDADNLDAGIVNQVGQRTTRATPGTISYLDTSLPPGNTLNPVRADQPATLSGLQSDFVLPYRGYGELGMASRVFGDYSTYSLFIEKRFSDNIFIEFAGNHQEQVRYWHVNSGSNNIYYDVNEQLPNGDPNPHFLDPYIVSNPTVREDYVESDEYRALALFKFEQNWFEQAIGFSVSFRQSEGGQFRRGLRKTNGSANLDANPNKPKVRYYLTDPSSTFFKDGHDYTVGSDELAYVNTRANQAGQAHNKDELISFLGYASGSWFPSKRLHTTFGFRRDKFYVDQYNTLIYDSTTREYIGNELSDENDGVVDSPSMGVVLSITDWLSAYGNISKSFVFGDKRQLNYQGSAVEPPIGESKEYGIRFNIGSKFNASIGYYDSVQQNNTAVLNSVNGRIRDIHDEMGLDDFGNPSDTSTLYAKGWEVQMTANPTRGWSIRANVAFPEGETERAYPSFFSYWDDNKAIYEAGVLNPDFDGEAIQGYLNTIENQIANLQADGTITETRSHKMLASFLTRYKFHKKSKLSGLTIGGGFRYRGEREISTVGQDTLIADGYFETSAFAQYAFKVKDVKMQLQLNVNNLFDDTNLRYNSVRNDGSLGSYRVSTPRQFRVTLTARF